MTRWISGVGSMLLVNAFLTACGGGSGVGLDSAGNEEPTDANVGQTEQAVRLGAAAGPNELLGLVWVSTPRGFCSGTVIASDTILTAAHCFCGEDLIGSNKCASDATITYRANPATGVRPASVHGTAHIKPNYNPSWTEGQYEHDVAVVTVDGVSPAYVTPVELTSNYLNTGSGISVAGFGHTGSGCSGATGTLNYDTTAIHSYEDDHDIMTMSSFVWCHGDSGGAILDADGRQRGIISMETPYLQKAVTTGSEFDWIKGFMCRSTPRNHCDGHGTTCNCSARKDILWQSSTGALAIWRLSGSNLFKQTLPGVVGSDWSIQGTGDFDGDGQADILWRHTSGQTAIWFMVNGVNVGQAYPGGQDAGLTWKIQGTGDFDGDGRADILWRHTSGQLAIWFQGDINKAGYPGYGNQPAPVDNKFQVRGVGDFDGDGKSDIFWQDTAGNLSIWNMSGALRVGEAYPGWMPPTTKFTGIGDFDGNLKSDILWRRSDGSLSVSFGGVLGNDTIGYQNSTGPGNLSWQVQGVGDFDHDGRDDILWKDPTGALSIWLVLGARFNGVLTPPKADASWAVKGMLAESGM